MKLIQQSKLFYQEGNSDKVYEIDLCELSPGSYIVNFRYGRRGSVLKEGTKTPEAVSREKAELIFSELENEKRHKGYQTEVETFVQLPSLEAVDPKSAKGAILQRLQDAAEGRNSFHTQWKTSRVIWRAGYLRIEEAIPFIIKLTNKGNEMQLYAALWALTQLKATQAEAIFRSYAFQSKQKPYLRNIACEGLLSILDEPGCAEINKYLLEKLPPEIRYDLETGNYQALTDNLKKDTEKQSVAYFSDLYLLCKTRTELIPGLHQALASWSFRPPYFQYIRSIYKLAQMRRDAATLSVLAYRFEKESAMFTRRVSLDSGRQMVTPIEVPVKIGEELKSKDSRIAYSHFTKIYFQKNSIRFLKNVGKDVGAKEYLKLVVSTLLQYSEADYTPAEERPLKKYGRYNYSTKQYLYTLVNYPECAGSLLLTTILFGNDIRRRLQPDMKFIYGQRNVTSSSYYYSPDKIQEVKASSFPKTQQQPKQNAGLLGVFKSLFGKKAEPVKTVNTAPPSTTVVEKPKENQSDRLELFPEHWDIMPEAYVQLLMQARMNLIHQFAYNNLKGHAQADEICRRFDEKALLQLLRSEFELPNRLGFETLEKRKDDFSRNIRFMCEALDTNSAPVRAWIRAIVDSNPAYYTDDMDFLVLLILNSQADNSSWISGLLKKTVFMDDRLKVLVGKLVAEWLSWENTVRNNEIAGTAIQRIFEIAPRQLSQISWPVVEQLMASPLEANTMLASSIVVQRSQQIISTDIPVSLVGLFLAYGTLEIRQNGLQLLHQYLDSFLADHIDFVLSLADSPFPDVVTSALNVVRKLLPVYPVGNPSVHHLTYALIRKETFEGAHALINQFINKELKSYWNTGLTPKDITKLVYAQYRESQLTGYEMLKNYQRPNDFTIGQIISFGNHEILAVRQWCWNYFAQNVARIRYERDKSLNLLDAKWDDTRAFAFHFFKTEFTASDWDTDTLIGIVDSIRPDVENFGKELIMQHFSAENALEYLTKLSEHPSTNVQLLVSNYLSAYAADNMKKLVELEYYFRSTLMRVNKGRVAKDRVFKFLHQEALKSPDVAAVITPLIDDISAQSTVQDKATCIHILTEVKNRYPHLEMHLMVKS